MPKLRTSWKNIVLAALLLTAWTGSQAAIPASVNGNEMPTLAPLVEKTSPAVVNIRTKAKVSAPNNPLMQDPFFRRFFGAPEGGQQRPEGGQQRQREVSSAGSGVIIDAKKGYILTNHHVINKADEIKVYLDDDGRWMPQSLVPTQALTLQLFRSKIRVI